MNKTLISLLIIILSVTSAKAQKMGDLLYLKNGSVINGSLIETTPDYYKIKTLDGSLFVYPTGEVEKVELNSGNKSSKNSGAFGFGIEAGFLAGVPTSTYVAPFSFNLFGILNISDNQSLSVGSGVEYLGQSYAPLFIEYRLKTTDATTTPFIFARGGALLYTGGTEEDNYYGNDREYRGGPSLTLGGGINWSKTDNDIYLSFAYRYARTEYTEIEYYSSSPTKYTTNWNRLEIKFGFRF